MTNRKEYLIDCIMHMIHINFDEIIFLMMLKRVFKKIHPSYDPNKIYKGTIYRLINKSSLNRLTLDDLLYFDYYFKSYTIDLNDKDAMTS